MPKNTTPEKLRQEYREKLQLRKMQPHSLPRKATYYTRYADDCAPRRLIEKGGYRAVLYER